MKTLKTIIHLTIVLLSMKIDASVLSVPANYSTIQSAINASINGDTIVVSTGTYFENINFRGKNITLTSLYYLNLDTSYISSTIINGSIPINSDTGSCVIFNSGEDSTAVLQGFTITGGTGTKWTDIHGAGIYREGGGILIELSSPSILHNIINNNTAINSTGVNSAGGGGIRIGDGNPSICNNLVTSNQGRYGAGIVLNYTGGKLYNNIISSNTGGAEYNGGSGIWIYNNLGVTPKYIFNNTIVNNSASLITGTGGIFISSSSNVFLRNNIVWDNIPDLQIKPISSLPEVIYSNVKNGFNGNGNINIDPSFDPIGFYLSDSSPCIDAGDSSWIYNDKENSSLPGNALFPSKGLVRNDMGAYGGPCASLLPYSQTTTTIWENPKTSSISITPNPFSDYTTIQSNKKINDASISIYDIIGKQVKQINNISQQTITIHRDFLPAGIYFVLFIFDDKSIVSNKLIISNDVFEK